MNAIEAHGTYKVFGKRPEQGVARLREGATREELRKEGITAAVIDASFEVREGEIFVVMGLSGSGKSTLIRMVNGLLGADGRRAARLRRRHRQDESAAAAADAPREGQHGLPALRAASRTAPSARTPRTACEIQGIPKHEREPRAKEALDLVGLQGLGGLSPGAAVRRHAAARRPGPGAGRGHQHHADGRGVQRARPADQARDAGPAGRAPAQAGQDHPVHHPRPQRGDAARRPDRDDARRPRSSRSAPPSRSSTTRPTTTSPSSCRTSTGRAC